MSDKDAAVIDAARLLYDNCKGRTSCAGCPLVRMEPKIDTLCRCRIGDCDMFPGDWRMEGIDG